MNIMLNEMLNEMHLIKNEDGITYNATILSSAKDKNGKEGIVEIKAPKLKIINLEVEALRYQTIGEGMNIPTIVIPKVFTGTIDSSGKVTLDDDSTNIKES